MSIKQSIVVEFWVDTYQPTRVKGLKSKVAQPHPFDAGCLLYRACTTSFAVPPDRNNVDLGEGNVFALAKRLILQDMIPGLPPAGWTPTPKGSDPTDIDLKVDINDDATVATAVLKVQPAPSSGAWCRTVRDAAPQAAALAVRAHDGNHRANTASTP